MLMLQRQIFLLPLPDMPFTLFHIRRLPLFHLRVTPLSFDVILDPSDYARQRTSAFITYRPPFRCFAEGAR